MEEFIDRFSRDVALDLKNLEYKIISSEPNVTPPISL
jgi:hypothetical protein